MFGDAKAKAAKRRAHVARGLQRAYEAAPTEQVELDALRIVILSDHHRGARDGADDFRRCERAYNAALAYYLESGHELVLLGDAEELWECDADEVIASYPRTYALEADFATRHRYRRMWGNHDDHWRDAAHVAEHREALGGDGAVVREAIRLEVLQDGGALGELFLVHGHQGTDDSERFSWFSRLVVRKLWRPLQRRLRIASTTPATDWDLREQHDEAMFAWASSAPTRPVVIAGHTHRPVFGVGRRQPVLSQPLEELERAYEAERRGGAAPERLAQLHAEIEFGYAETRRYDQPPIPVVPPCYFNTGCCSFGDGDISGLELADGRIRLVRWLDDEQHPAVKLLADAPLDEVLRAVRAGDEMRVGERADLSV
jgi:UDP-2,3-diacylglucosamine pyrophosphatase LpxH